jgi:hypothetical protein
MIGTTGNACSEWRGAERSVPCDFSLKPGEEPALASHLVTPRTLYTHHGIYVGNGCVIHYSSFVLRLRRGRVEAIPLEGFSQGRGIRIRCDQRSFGQCEVVERVRSRLGERRYRLLTNNCEHFCAWALRDELRSRQVEFLWAAPRALFRDLWTQCKRLDRYHFAVVKALRLWWRVFGAPRNGHGPGHATRSIEGPL